MTKAEVIAAITEKMAKKKDKLDLIGREEVSEVLETLISVLKESMEKGENIYMRGFGSFINKKRAKKIARNILQNTAMVIDAHYIPSFKPSKSFINKIKNSDMLKAKLAKEAAEDKA